MVNKLLRILLLLGMVAPVAATAGEVYRTVDEHGQVIFTDTPPVGQPGVEVLELPSAPSDDSRREAESRLEEYRRKLEEDRLQREDAAKARAARIERLKQELAEAEQQLEQTRVLKDEDRQSLAGRGRRIRPEYFQRIEEAEAAVAEARKRLNQARSGR